MQFIEFILKMGEQFMAPNLNSLKSKESALTFFKNENIMSIIIKIRNLNDRVY